MIFDLDHCRNAETGEIEKWAEDIVDRLDSYTEISASGTGSHVIVKATIPKNYHPAHSQIEVYGGPKFMSLTGDTVLPWGPIEERDLTRLIEQLEKKAVAPVKSSGDQSADDFKLACELAREFGDHFEKVKAALLQQAKQRPKLRRADYVERTVRKAIEKVQSEITQGEPDWKKELEEGLAYCNEHFFVVENFGNKCCVCWLDPDPIFSGRKILGIQFFADFKNRYMHQEIQIGVTSKGIPTMMDKGSAWLEWEHRRQYREVLCSGERTRPWQSESVERIRG